MTATIVDNPYIGPRTFSYAERHLFFGREREARDLLARALSERLLLFYAQSGAGKSSLLHTRLIPQLQEEKGFGVLPVGRVSGEVPRGVAQVDNIYVFNLLASIDEGDDPARLAHVSIADFLSRLVLKDGQRWVYDAAVVPVPPAAGGNRRYVLIVDQFEEIISSHRARWQEREDFFRQLDQAMAGDPNLWVVLTLREDYVAALDPYASLVADRLRARFYMERMGIDAALEAVQRPAELGGRPFAPGVAEKLVDDLRLEHVAGQQELVRGQYVEPVQLQVVCRQLWESVKNRPDATITLADLAAYGDVEQALVRFYEDSVQAVAAMATLGVTERQLRRWFDSQLITEAGTRGLVRQGAETTKGLPNTAVRQLQERFLVRGEARSGDTWIELIHDRLVEPVRRSNRAWFELHEDPLTQAARSWVTAGRPGGLLLHGRDLTEIEARARQAPESLSDLEREFLAASRQAAQRQFTWRLVAGAVAAMAILALAIIALLQSRSAADQMRLADEANRAKETALALQASAEQQALALRTAVAREEQANADKSRLNRRIRAGQLAAKADVAAGTSPQLGLLLAATGATRGQEMSGQLTLVPPEVEQTLRRLLAATGGEAIPLALQPEGVPWDIAVNQEGLVAAGDSQGTVHLRSLEPDEDAEIPLQDGAGDVLEVAYSPDGGSLAAGGGDGIVRLWDVRQPQAAPTKLPGHNGQVAALAFSSDGELLATGGDDGAVRLWNVPDLEQRLVISPTAVYSGPIAAVALSPDSQWLAVASIDSPARLIRLARPAAAPVELGGQEAGSGALAITTLAFAPPAGGQLLAGTAEGKLLAWDMANSGDAPVQLAGHSAAIEDLAADPTGEWLVTAGQDGTAGLWRAAEVASGVAAPVLLRGHEGPLLSVVFSPDGRYFLTSSSDGSIRRWEVGRPTAQPLVLAPDGVPVGHFAVSSDSRRLAGIGLDGTELRLWDLVDPVAPPLAGNVGGIDAISGVGFRDQDGAVLTLSAAGGLAESDQQTGAVRDLAQAALPGLVTTALVDDDGERWVLLSEDGGLYLWQPAMPESNLLLLPIPEVSIADLALSADGSRLAAAAGPEVWLYDLDAAGAVPERLDGPRGDVLTVALSADGLSGAGGGAEGELVLWDLAGEEPAWRRLTGHETNVLALGFGQRGGRPVLASGGGLGELNLWDLDEKELLEPVPVAGHVGSVWEVGFSPDGRWLISAGEDGAVRLWNVSVAELVDLACQTAGRSLNPKERERYLPGEEQTAACGGG